MEETNYHPRTKSHDHPKIGVHPVETESLGADNDPKSKTNCDMKDVSAHVAQDGSRKQSKQYLQKLRLFEEGIMDHPHRLKGMIVRPLIFLSFPVILYAGFSYGSNLVWFNVLNGTASLILSQKPYVFSSSMVGLAYLSPLLGATLG